MMTNFLSLLIAKMILPGNEQVFLNKTCATLLFKSERNSTNWQSLQLGAADSPSFYPRQWHYLFSPSFLLCSQELLPWLLFFPKIQLTSLFTEPLKVFKGSVNKCQIYLTPLVTHTFPPAPGPPRHVSAGQQSLRSSHLAIHMAQNHLKGWVSALPI